MFAELSDEMIYVIVGAFMLGCILAAMVNRANSDSRSKKRDPRDDRIRALEAELRVAKSVSEDSRTDVEKLQDELKETTVGLVRRDDVITQQQTKIQKVSSDLEKSVMKTGVPNRVSRLVSQSMPRQIPRPEIRRVPPRPQRSIRVASARSTA